MDITLSICSFVFRCPVLQGKGGPWGFLPVWRGFVLMSTSRFWVVPVRFAANHKKKCKNVKFDAANESGFARFQLKSDSVQSSIECTLSGTAVHFLLLM